MANTGLGELEQLVLLAVVRLGTNAYAVSVRNEIEARAGRAVSRGAVYVTLDRLARKGYLRSQMGKPTAARGGKAKRLFEVEGAGLAALQVSLGGLERMMEGVDRDMLWGTAS